ncbi:MAG: sugar phosphate isomerase/epimerase [Acidimicrobiaceae bacterium]|nr:sugar phosphate isomerase/epimerase [Acidimicrobiaceae bacterium]
MANTLVAHTNSFHTHPFEAALSGIAEAGFQHVELSAVRGWTEHVDVDDDPAPTVALLEQAGLQAVALSGHSDLTTDAGVSLAVRAIQWAAAAGLDRITTAIGGHAGQHENLSDFLSRVAVVAESAARSEVVVALEVHGDIMATGLKSRELIERIGSDWVRIKYDTANVEFYGGVKAVDDIHHVLPYLVNVDAKDKRGGVGVWDFPPPGEGSIDWPRLIGILRAGGYAGPVTVEIEFRGEPWPSPPEVTEALRTARRTLEPLLA